MAEVIDMVVDNRTFKEKVQAKWYEITGKAQRAGRWMLEHPVETAGAVTMIVGATAEGRRVFDRAKTLHDEKQSRLSCYCNDVQGYVRLKHELNYKENRTLRDLMSQGYTRFEALDKMRLLK